MNSMGLQRRGSVNFDDSSCAFIKQRHRDGNLTEWICNDSTKRITRISNVDFIVHHSKVLRVTVVVLVESLIITLKNNFIGVKL